MAVYEAEFSEQTYEDVNPWASTRRGMTPANRRVLTALAAVLEREGTASIREVGTEAGLTSTSSVAFQLHKLAALGMVNAPVRNRPRGWQLTDHGRSMAGASAAGRDHTGGR